MINLICPLYSWNSNASNARNAGTFLGLLVNYNVIIPTSLISNPIIPMLFGGGYNVIFKGLVKIPK